MEIRPAVAITSGDPAGIGPEVVLKALPGLVQLSGVQWLIIGDWSAYEATARACGLTLPMWQRLRSGASPLSDASLIPHAEPIVFIDGGVEEAWQLGVTSAHAGRAAQRYLDMALDLWRVGRIRGLVTAPVTKASIEAGGRHFRGHTEYLAEAMGVRDVVMLFCSDKLRVALASRHIPLAEVALRVDEACLSMTIAKTHEALRRLFGIVSPRVAVTGLNPHAGEGGLFGREEQSVFRPVQQELLKQGIACEGPFAADGFFAGAYQNYDAVVCWYHDQGLIPFKLLARDSGCQISVGLPIVRTSPDHGSALDIAGKNQAHPGAMAYALDLAARLVGRTPQP
jgi:4-hydroxythreonine-4-phosphate dehydrogenase